MPYLKFRISCSPLDASGNYDGVRTRHRILPLVKHLFKRIQEQDSDALVTCGFETFNNYGDPCHHHYHLHSAFDPNTLSNPLRTFKDSLRKKAKDLGIHLAGNKVWSFTLVEEPKDFDRFLRYPLKETPVKPMCANAWGFNPTSHDESYSAIFEEQTLLAREEQKRSIELNILKREKTMEKQTFRDKLFEWLDAGEDTHHTIPPEARGANATVHPTQRQIWNSICHYYHIVAKKAICPQTITGYTLGYQLHIGTISYDELFDLRSNLE